MSDPDSKTIFNKMFNCVNSGISWSLSPTKSSVCPPKKKKIDEKDAEDQAKRSLDEGLGDEGAGAGAGPDPSRKRSWYIPPSQICPNANKRCCVIKMQDPCAPCCCDNKPKYDPCPPKPYPPQPREPVCGCDLCQKHGGNEKCCDRNRAYRDINVDPRYFEKA